jgi:hypothetical protein
MPAFDIDRLRADLFLRMIDQSGESLLDMATERAALFGEHAARLARAAMEGTQYFDRTGTVRDPSRTATTQKPAARA